ncbi:MAG: hypothetical protein DI551_02740 [Micavibrio aeruginosavorus]|uniref:Uncharacterized protein n=1 Tax=Micavibrio aeruginosavorus TaxID=349221 RepID=A0A2W5PSK0_9BACT|nr:MAG: hypothetical protein DI551_02740 [Micavibrio aeruginosavorus]
MKTQSKMTKEYEQRLQVFLDQLKAVERSKQDLYEIMDMVVFRDLETALMMATMQAQTTTGRHRRAAV